MRSFLIMSIAAVMLVLSACQPQDDGMDNSINNNDGLQQTRYGEERNNTNFNRNNDNNFNNGMMNRDDNLDDGALNPDLNNEETQNRDRQNENNDNYDVADRIADRITDEVDEVQRAYVLTGENNAYVAVVLKRNDNQNRDNDNQNLGNDDYEIDNDLKRRIADVVQQSNRSVDNVYVSANADFLQMIDSYVNDVRNGQPIQGFFEEFNNMIERIFPNLE